MRKFAVLRILVILILSVTVAYGDSGNDSWPTWRGPHMMGISPEGNPPITWSETENIKWKVELTGDGSNSSPIIWEDKIFFQSAVKTDKKPEGAVETPEEKNQEQSGQPGGGRRGGGRFGVTTPINIYEFKVVCLDRKTGKMLWEKTVCEVVPHEGHHQDHGFASYSPVTDGKLIWANFGSRGVYCLDMDGNLKWKKDLGLKNTRASFGEGNSPALAGDNLIVLKDHEGDSFICALNQTTGEEVWKQSRDESTSWTSPIVTEFEGQTQIIVSGTNRTRCYNAGSGELIWECGGQTRNVIPTPVLGFGMVFCTSGFRGSKLQAIKLGKTGDLTGTDAIAWEVNKGTPYVPSPLLYGDKIYVCSGNNGVISCYNAQTGKPYYVEKDLEGIKNIYASPVGAADRVYFVGRDGTAYVLKNTDTFEVLAVNKLDDPIDCAAAIVGEEMYIKGKKFLYCLANSDK
ncbi:MAG: PQQ-like beta-propeller repeat protein [Sedimentisphaerales bacterium]|nr:PQQ-like beta-propeller repeat protein [Sedimentisphaerales bacterium]